MRLMSRLTQKLVAYAMRKKSIEQRMVLLHIKMYALIVKLTLCRLNTLMEEFALFVKRTLELSEILNIALEQYKLLRFLMGTETNLAKLFIINPK